MHINLIARTNGVGIDADVTLLKKALEKLGYEITVSHSRSRGLIGRVLGKKNIFDANIFLERTFPNWFNASPINLLIPNQERFPKRHLNRLKKIDYVLCKTRHAEEVFSKYGASTKYIGFTSKNVFLNDQETSYQRFFHLAGKSTLKGTETILSLWEKHPEWPQLTLVQHKENAPASVSENVTLISERLSEGDLSKLTNEIGIHICTSLSEGWGHYIVEGMSCEAVVVTTEAPPMNELVAGQRGITIPYHKSESRHLGTNYYVDKGKLENEIETLIAMSDKDKLSIGIKARSWNLENHTSFHQNIITVMDEVL